MAGSSRLPAAVFDSALRDAEERAAFLEVGEAAFLTALREECARRGWVQVDVADFNSWICSGGNVGISTEQFFATSQNGKGMILMIARAEKVELVKDICEWLCVQHGKDVLAGALANGATLEQAQIIGADATARWLPVVDEMNARNVYASAERVVDVVFKRHHDAGPAHYTQTMVKLANLLRQRVKD